MEGGEWRLVTRTLPFAGRYTNGNHVTLWLRVGIRVRRNATADVTSVFSAVCSAFQCVLDTEHAEARAPWWSKRYRSAVAIDYGQRIANAVGDLVKARYIPVRRKISIYR